MKRVAVVAAVLAARTAAAQPTEHRDDKQLADTIAQITNDPAIQVADPAHRAVAQALMLEGVKRLQAQAYDQALANFLEAYAKFPSPKILLNIGSTLRDMGRHADAANTYQRYLDDPATGVDRTAEVRELLIKLDEQLTLLQITVTPRGSDLSIDGGPFVPVGQLLVTRVRPGLHLIRIRKADRSAELTINGFEGEMKPVDARLPPAPAPPASSSPVPAPAPAPAPPAPEPAALPDRISPWLTNGTQYSSEGGAGHVRRTRAGYGGADVAPYIPAFELDDAGAVRLRYPQRTRISSGAIAVLRIDGKLRGFAGGLGFAIARGRFELDLMGLRSDVTGAYLGGRVRLMSGWLRPYLAAGAPAFLYDDMDDKKLAVGVRAAGGVELVINEHLSLQADVGYEHFFGVEDTEFEADVLVPTVGVIGRL